MEFDVQLENQDRWRNPRHKDPVPRPLVGYKDPVPRPLFGSLHLKFGTKTSVRHGRRTYRVDLTWTNFRCLRHGSEGVQSKTWEDLVGCRLVESRPMVPQLRTSVEPFTNGLSVRRRLGSINCQTKGFGSVLLKKEERRKGSLRRTVSLVSTDNRETLLRVVSTLDSRP